MEVAVQVAEVVLAQAEVPTRVLVVELTLAQEDMTLALAAVIPLRMR